MHGEGETDVRDWIFMQSPNVKTLVLRHRRTLPLYPIYRERARTEGESCMAVDKLELSSCNAETGSLIGRLRSKQL